MTSKRNSATRILAVLEVALREPQNPPTHSVWAKALGLDVNGSPRTLQSVVQLLTAMSAELDLAREHLAKIDFTKSLYEIPLDKIENAISPIHFTNSWLQVSHLLAPDVIISLKFLVEILPDEESEISEESLEEINRKVEELRASAEDSEIPLRLARLISHHIKLIERALSEYQITGAKAFREVARTALGEMIEAKDELAKEKNSPTVEKLKSAWDTVNKVTDTALKSEKVAQLGQKAWETLSNLL
jgi:hypothetical protein